MKKQIVYQLLLSGLLLLVACQSKSQQSGSSEAGKAPETAQEQSAKIFKLLDPEGFKQQLEATPDAQLIDVRTEGEVASGHLANARNINLQSPDFKEQLSTLDPAKPVFVYCAKGARSGQSAEIMKKMGFQEIYDLKGGIIQWKSSGLPVVTP
ncbi:MAG: rhodanese-like domain-containing protein [Bacteroidia bacterium]